MPKFKNIIFSTNSGLEDNSTRLKILVNHNKIVTYST